MSDAWKHAVWVPWPHSGESAGPRVASPGPHYLDPAILRGFTTLSPPPRAPLVRLHVVAEHRLRCDYQPGQRVEFGDSSVDQLLRTVTINVRWATVVSWDRASGELVVQPGAVGLARG